MEQIFQMSETLCSQIDQFSGQLDTLRAGLESLDEYAFAEQATELALSLRCRTDDFFRENRIFSIAVLGQLKAGKSTFLNDLLFDGHAVLPVARTPKTAALTRLEYAPENALTVEYLSAGEWETLQKLAASRLDTPQVRAARETVGLVQDGGAALESKFALGTERIPLADTNEPGTLLNDYVGENGRFTPAVKCLTLGLRLESLRHLSIVDTPGFYDPVLSRVERARRCLETCDAAFYLSRAGEFLDRYDLELLTELIPQRGVSSLTLIASQMDSALADALPAYPGIREALTGVQEALRNRAEQSLDPVLQGTELPVPAAVAQCRRPVFISALADQMSQKEPEAYNGQERLIARLLSTHGTPDTEMLRAIGNMEEARGLFFRLASEKEAVLLRRLDALLLSSQSELSLMLMRIRAQTRQHLSTLKQRKQELLQRQEAIAGTLRLIKARVNGAFGEYLAPLEQALSRVCQGLRRLREAWTAPAPREDFVLKAQVRTISDARPLRPWTWGKSHSECTREKIPRTYLDPEDVRRSVEQVSAMAATLTEREFMRFSDLATLTDMLFAAGNLPGAVQDPISLRIAVEKALSRLSRGRPPLPGSFFLPEASRNPEGDEALCAAAKKAVAQITESYERAVQREAERLREGVNQAQSDFRAALFRELQQEQEALSVQQRRLEALEERLQKLLDLAGKLPETPGWKEATTK